jgi:4-hydroxymandelate synthase
MAVLGIDYVELFVADSKFTIDFFVSAMGFENVAECVGPDGDSTLLRQGVSDIVVTAGPRIGTFIEAHGDGIADIAIRCDDPASTAAAAIAAGGRTSRSEAGQYRISTFGDVVHTLLPADRETGALPPGRDWVARADSSRSEAGRPSGTTIRSLDHVAVCVESGSLDMYADFYTALGCPRYSTEYVDVGDNAMDSVVVRNASGGVTFTFVAPDQAKGSGQLDAFLERNDGPGVQHLAFLVDDIVAAVADRRRCGVEFLRTPDSYYDLLTERFADMSAEISRLRNTDVLADRDEWGYLLQLFTRSPFERNTLFFELIQRRGSKGFGSANIRALYEAVERDRLAAE